MLTYSEKNAFLKATERRDENDCSQIIDILQETN